MTGLQDWMTSPAARALAWALVHFLWQGAAIALLLAVGLGLCRAARVRYALACGAMVAMVLAFGVTLAVCWPANTASSKLPVGPRAALRLTPLPARGHGAIPTPPEPAPPRWFVPAWLGGVSLFYLYSLVAWMAATRLKIRGTIPAPLEWQERLRSLAAQLGLRRTITLLESCLTDVPVVIGYFRPVILLPLGLLTGLSSDQVEAILIHELAHIRRYDYLVNGMQTLVAGLLFYHPAVWWVGSLMRSEREHCCDDVVVDLQGDARGYAVTLARLELSRGTVREPALAATGGNLMKRVHRLMQQPEGPRMAAPLLSAAVLAATATLAFAAWQSQTPPPASPQVETPPVARPLTPRQLRAQQKVLRQELVTPYLKWLNEDVTYIITDEERAAFKKLQTDEEREQFIEQFWVRRDPTPGTIENEYKQEHYRRIAYANEHFASAIPGWKTDRGRIYIIYGPPDEIEDHSAGGKYVTPDGTATTTYPFQQWRYRFIEGMGNNVIMEFVDTAKNGEYHLTMDPTEKDALLQAQNNLAITVNVTPAPQTYVGNLAQTTEVQARVVTVTVPMLSHGKNQATLRVMTMAGRPVANFALEAEGTIDSYSRTFSLVPGSYRVSVIAKDIATGTQQHGETVVQVQ
ncbi:MAG: GWxTD domain-containing protein [Candidatus Sulfopaludibacter sp.]|nr:GWxTD domain-containing protein [Candidatus Sulfopaludibacter sp.]